MAALDDRPRILLPRPARWFKRLMLAGAFFEEVGGVVEVAIALHRDPQLGHRERADLQHEARFDGCGCQQAEHQRNQERDSATA